MVLDKIIVFMISKKFVNYFRLVVPVCDNCRLVKLHLMLPFHY